MDPETVRTGDGSSSEDLPESAGRYRIGAEIARGGMGAVFRGRDSSLSRDVALKVMLRRHNGDAEIVRRFVEEAQIGGQLQHPGIVPIYEFGVLEGDRPFFAMKLVKGETLAARLRGRTSPDRDRHRFLEIYRQVCLTMAYAHARGVIHRDLKPSNVMIGAHGEVQVLDWGLAKVLGQGGTLDDEAAGLRLADHTVIDTVRTRTEETASEEGSVVGTLAYMAPEQARGETGAVDERADVFSLGAILCEILTGSAPYAGTEPGGLRRRAETGDVGDALARIAACGADPEVCALATRALSPAPEDRPRHAEAVADAITAHLGVVEDRARTAALQAVEARVKAQEAGKRVLQERRARRLGLAAGVLVLLSALGGGIAFVSIASARRQRGLDAARRAESALSEAIQFAGEARSAPGPDPVRWQRALDAVLRAREVCLAGDAPSSLLERVESLSEAIGAEAARARAVAEERRRDREVTDLLEELRCREGEHLYSEERGAQFMKVFESCGLAIGTEPVEVLAPRIAASAVAGEIVAALDHWSWLIKNSPGTPDVPLWKKLRTLILACDRNPRTKEIRRLSQERDVEGLRKAARALDPAAEPVHTTVLLGDALLAAGDAASALEFLRRSWWAHPVDFWIHHGLAGAYRKLEPPDFESALRHLYAAQALRPASHTMWDHLGFTHLSLDHGEQAIACFRKLVAADPEHAVGWNNLGLMLETHRRDVPGALEAYRKAESLNSRDPVCQFNIGAVLLASGEPREAVGHLLAAVTLGYMDPEAAANNLVRACRETGGLKLARESLRRAAAEPPPRFSVRVALAKVAQAEGDEDTALGELRKALEIDPRHPAAATPLTQILLGRGELAEVEALCAEALERSPDVPALWHNLGVARLKRGVPTSALPALEKARDLDPGYADVHNEIGNALRMLGRTEEAVAAHLRCLALDPEHRWARSNLGNEYQDLGDAEAACRTYREAVRRCGDRDVCERIGRYLGRHGDLEGAAEAFREAARLAPGDAGILRLLAETEARRGNWLASEDAWARCLKLTPSDAEAEDQHRRALVELGATDALPPPENATDPGDLRPPGLRTAIGRFHRLWGDTAAAHRALTSPPGGESRDLDARLELARVLRDLGRFDDAAAAARRVADSDSASEAAIAAAEDLAATCERLAGLDRQPVDGSATVAEPEDVPGRILVAWLHRIRGRPLAAVRAWRAVLEADPAAGVAGGDETGWFLAARAAAAAAALPAPPSGTESPDAGMREELRGLASAWLRRGLEVRAADLEAGGAARSRLLRDLRALLAHEDLRSLREDAALEVLPPPVRAGFRESWKAVEDLLARAQRPISAP